MYTALMLALSVAIFRVLDPLHPREIPRIREFQISEFFRSQLKVLGAGLALLGVSRMLEMGLPGLRALEAFLWIGFPMSWILVIRRDLSLTEWIMASGLTLGLLPVFPALGWGGAGRALAAIWGLSLVLEIGLRAFLDRLVYSPQGRSRAVWGIALFSLAILLLILESAAAQWTELHWLHQDPALLYLFGAI